MEIKHYNSIITKRLLKKSKWKLKKKKTKPRDKLKQKHNDPKLTGCNKVSFKREAYSNAIPPQEIRKKIIKKKRNKKNIK